MCQNEKNIENNGFPQAPQKKNLAPRKQIFPTKVLTAPKKVTALPGQPAFFQTAFNDPFLKNKVEKELTAEEKKE